MSQTWAVPFDLNDPVNQLLDDSSDALQSVATLFSGASAPSSPFAGMLWHDTTNNLIALRNQANSAWITLIPVSTATAGGFLALTGGTMSGAIAMGSQKVTGLANGTDAGDAVNKSQVDARPQWLSIPLGTLSATTTAFLVVTRAAITVADVDILSASGTTSDGSNNWAIQVDNVTDTLNLRSAAKSTNGAEITANTVYALGLDQNLSVSANKVLRITLTLTGSPGNLNGALAQLRYTVAT